MRLKRLIEEYLNEKEGETKILLQYHIIDNNEIKKVKDFLNKSKLKYEFSYPNLFKIDVIENNYTKGSKLASKIDRFLKKNKIEYNSKLKTILQNI